MHQLSPPGHDEFTIFHHFLMYINVRVLINCIKNQIELRKPQQLKNKKITKDVKPSGKCNEIVKTEKSDHKLFKRQFSFKPTPIEL